jgi:hypothetical protein
MLILNLGIEPCTQVFFFFCKRYEKFIVYVFSIQIELKKYLYFSTKYYILSTKKKKKRETK